VSVTVVGLAGPSASGKTLIAEHLSARLPSVVHLQQDSYFIDPVDCPEDANFYEQQYLRWPEFVSSLQGLARGEAATVPLVDFATFARRGAAMQEPKDVLVVEGMSIFRDPAVVSCCHLRYYVNPPDHVLEGRKRKRDAAERGKSDAIIAVQLEWMRTERDRDMFDLASGALSEARVCILGGEDLPLDVQRVLDDLLAVRGEVG
jgi:uridine kinase